MKHNNASIPARAYDNPVVQEAVADRLVYLQAKRDQLYSIEIYFVVAYEGWKPNKILRVTISDFVRAPVRSLREMLSPQQKITALQTELDHARETLANKVMSFIVQLPETLHVRALGKEQAF